MVIKTGLMKKICIGMLDKEWDTIYRHAKAKGLTPAQYTKFALWVHMSHYPIKSKEPKMPVKPYKTPGM